ncbi:uncharacterized protein LOC124657125 [Lolium rigidum]|uniref:uncharacterized protein LOC124657125 n=1 Tax=Lolium rigidum TaxID=89674 RepID=UPI001F5D65B5|nr:uncharacterized protein LOC124657125 [Lolium rigidum]
MVWLLDQEYDSDRRAFHMTERRTDLHPLKIRYHGTVDMAYDERYTEFIQPTGLLPFITLDLIGMAPPAPEDKKDRAPAGAPFAWIRTNFGQPPQEDANEDTIRTYTRVYLWYMISRTLFADSGGKLAHWCWLKALTVLERRWSWGTAALAYLYRQLDDACRRTGSGGIGGCLLLLSVWSWDRISVGRPRVLTERRWPHYWNNLDREPTWAFLWDNVSEMTSDPKIMYMQYTEELDTLTAEHECPPQWQDTDQTLHSNYLQWFHESTRIELVKPAYEDDILYDPIEFDEVIPDDDTILSQGIASKRKKQATRSAYQLKPRGKAPARYTPDDYVNREKKVVIEEDETLPRRSTLRKMRNDEPGPANSATTTTDPCRRSSAISSERRPCLRRPVQTKMGLKGPGPGTLGRCRPLSHDQPSDSKPPQCPTVNELCRRLEDHPAAPDLQLHFNSKFDR